MKKGLLSGMSRGVGNPQYWGIQALGEQASKPPCVSLYLGLPGCTADKLQHPRLEQHILGPPGLSHA